MYTRTLAAAAFGLGLLEGGAAALAADDIPPHMEVRCIDARPNKSAEYKEVMLATTAKTMQVRADDGDMAVWVFAESILPAGSNTECDFMLINQHAAFPPERVPIDPYFVRAKVNITREQWYAKLGAASRFVHRQLWRGVQDLGHIQKGNYIRVDTLKVAPEKMEAWVEQAVAVWKPIFTQKIAAGDLTAWQAQRLILPSGGSLPYNARTLTIYPSWNAIGMPERHREYLAKSVPGKRSAKLLEGALAGQEVVRSELFSVVEVVYPKKPAHSGTAPPASPAAPATQ